MNNLFLIVILFFTIHSESYFSQSNDAKSLMKKIEEITKKRTIAQLPIDNKIYYFKNKIKIVFSDIENSPDLIQNIEIKISKDQLHYITDDLEMHQDRSDLFLIVHLSKTIMHSVSRFNEMFSKDINGVEILDEMFFKMTKSISLDEYVTKSGQKIQKLVMNMDTTAQYVYHIKKVICHYSPVDNKLLITEAFFNSDYKYKKQTIWYYIENYDYKEKLETRAINYVLDKKGKLLPQYANYEYINDKDY